MKYSAKHVSADITIEKMFWPGSLMARGFDSILSAAAAGGYGALAVSPLMISQLLSGGKSASDIVDKAGEKGITLTQLDGVSSWAPVWYDDDLPLPLKERFNLSGEACLDLADAVGIKSMLVAGVFRPGAVARQMLVESFGTFCDAAATRNMRVDLEFIPFWGIPDLGAAWDIVKSANRTNSGLVIDTWHFQKGSRDFERDLALLATIPGERLMYVQLADASLQQQTKSLLLEASFRQFPGDGELAIDRIVQAVSERGGLKYVGTEVFGNAIDALPLDVAGSRSAAATDAVLSRMDERFREK